MYFLHQILNFKIPVLDIGLALALVNCVTELALGRTVFNMQFPIGLQITQAVMHADFSPSILEHFVKGDRVI